MLANELAGLRASRADLDGLASYDTRNLVISGARVDDPLDDPLLSDGLDIFEVRDELKPMARPDFVADRRPCPDFERFEPLFEDIRKSVEEGTRKPQPFRQERVDLGEFFVLKGQLVHVADLRDEHRRNGNRTVPTTGFDARLWELYAPRDRIACSADNLTADYARATLRDAASELSGMWAYHHRCRLRHSTVKSLISKFYRINPSPPDAG